MHSLYVGAFLLTGRQMGQNDFGKKGKYQLLCPLFQPAEGNGRFTKPDRKNFFVIARGSAQECVPLLELTCLKGFIDGPCHQALRGRLEVIAKMMSGLINGLANRQV